MSTLSMSSFATRLHSRIQQTGTAALVGLDPRWDQLPQPIRGRHDDRPTAETAAAAFRDFCCGIIDAVADLVPAVKPQVAFFEQLGAAGFSALREIMQHARERQLLVIADAKRGDIGSTAAAYADAWLAGADPGAAPFPADALTVNAYLGRDTLEPFLTAAKERHAGIYVLVRTSNPGATDFQNLSGTTPDAAPRKLYEAVADCVRQLNAEYWPEETYGSVGAVVGATWPQELVELRKRMPNAPLLIPGYGSQGGTAADVLPALDGEGFGALINNSRGINFAYRLPKYKDGFTESQWQEAAAAATRDMIADLSAAQLKIFAR